MTDMGRNNVAQQPPVKNHLGLFKLSISQTNRNVHKNTDTSSVDNQMALFPKAPPGVQVGTTDDWGKRVH
jgi:hypothetical protein